MAEYEETISETLGLDEDIPVGSSVAIAEGLGTLAELAGGQTVDISDALSFPDLVELIAAFPREVAEGVGFAPDATALWAVLVSESLLLDETLSPETISLVSLADGVGFTDVLMIAHPVAIAEGLGLAEQLLIAQVVIVAEELGLAPELATTTTFNGVLTETFGLAPELTLFLGAEVSETLGFQPALTVLSQRHASIAEGVGLEATLTPHLLMHVTVEEGLGLDPEAALQTIFSGVISEAIGFSIGFLDPGGSFTTWVMNARTGAVTEYDNYDFNSFARVGNKYIAASPSGLYELLGNDDAGDDIVARLKSGFMQFGGTKLSRLKAAYMAVRGEGDFVLKIETTQGETYNYAVSTRDMRSTKVHMGKGQRARYFSFELTSEGQDFDLDTLEFVPIVVQRRV